MPRPKEQLLNAVKNGSRTKQEATPKPAVSAALKEAIDRMDHMQLRLWVKQFCEKNEPLRKRLEMDLFVPGKEVHRYHADSESEDDGVSENENTKDENHSDGDEDRDFQKLPKPIAVVGDKMVPRIASCLNCKTNFNVSANDSRQCIWHPGQKEVCNDADFWADHDEECHGYVNDLFDEPDYADGFRWSCCNELGGATGCKFTKHKTAINQIRYPPRVGVSVTETSSRKRKAETQMWKPR